MAGLIERHQQRAPRTRVRRSVASAEFFPGEAARLLGLDGVDYAQLRAMFRLARVSRGESPPTRGWARYTLADLAAVEVLVQLGGGREALLAGRRLLLGGIESACVALRGRGFEDPLLQVPMVRVGRRVLAHVDGLVVEPQSGQVVLSVVNERTQAFLVANSIADPVVRRAVESERRRLRPRRRRIVNRIDAFGSLDGVLSS